jgi:hypothetical protein
MADAYTLEQLAEVDYLPCTKCDGSTIISYKTMPDIAPRPCPFCNGRGHFHQVDLSFLLDRIKGRKAGTLRSKRPNDDRAWYVWRMARFHGGADVSMPMTASFAVTGDPYVPYLDEVAKAVAQTVYGTDAAGSLRWAHAMGHEVSDRYLDGSEIVPASAMPGGPVVLDNHKPYSERAELV